MKESISHSQNRQKNRYDANEKKSLKILQENALLFSKKSRIGYSRNVRGGKSLEVNKTVKKIIGTQIFDTSKAKQKLTWIRERHA